MKIVIVGGVAGGLSVAARLRRLDESAEIVVFERTGFVSFANCGLPYHVGGVIGERHDLLPESPTSLGRRFNIDVRVHHDVESIDRPHKTVSVRNLETGSVEEESYDTLVLSPGAAPLRLKVPGAERILALRSIDELDRIMDKVNAQPPTKELRAIVVGAGFIGLELADNLLARDAHVTCVQHGFQVLPPLDPEMAAPIATKMRKAGIDIRFGVEIVSYHEDVVELSDGSQINTDIVVAGIGVIPETRLAESAGITIGPTGGIAVDEYHRTNDPHVYAIGDAVEKIDAILGEKRLIALAGLSNRHGRAVADTITGNPSPAKEALATAIVVVAGIAAASVGWNEKQLKARGRAMRIVHAHPTAHAPYYPKSRPLAMKLIVDPDSDRILGAQITGSEGVDKRIDVIATAISAGITASGLADVELAYAPQFGSAKDAINILGYIAANEAAGQDPTIQWHELEAARDAGATLVDVRPTPQLVEGGIPGAVHIPITELRSRAATLGDGPVITHCRVGQNGHNAQRILSQLGFDVRNLDGGYRTWAAGMASMEHNPHVHTK